MVNGTYLFLAMATAVRILIKMIIFINSWMVYHRKDVILPIDAN